MPTDELVLLTAGIFSCPRFLAVDHAGTHHADGKVRKFLVGAVLRAFKLCWHSSMVPAHPASQERIFASHLETHTGRASHKRSDARPV